MTDGTQYVTLGVDRDLFAIPVGGVREILNVPTTARLPHAPPFLLGIIDVRGRAVPVVSLRRKLGLPDVDPTPDARILVLEVTKGERLLVVGLLADRVFEVTGLDSGRLEAPPEAGPGWRPNCVAGVGRRGGNFVVVLDVAHLLASDDAAALDIGAPDEPASRAEEPCTIS